MVEISVIIPTYNVEKFIGETLESVINQTFEDMEIICVNDGSSDGTLDILKEYSNNDGRIKIIDKENGGVGSARNRGLDAAKGKYIIFLDSDDMLDLNALSELYDIANEKNTDLIMFRSVNFNDESAKDFIEEYNSMEQIPDSFNNSLFSFKDLLEYFSNMDVTVSTKFFKHELIEDVRFDEDVIFEDNLFTLDYFFNADKIYLYDKVLHHRRIRAGSIITSTSKRHVDGIEVNNRMIKKIQDAGYYDDVKEELFVKNFTKISYRFIDIDDEYKEYFYDCFKGDLMGKAENIKSNLNFDLIDKRTAFIFDKVIESSHFWELELRIRIYDYENQIAELNNTIQQLVDENKKLKMDLEKYNWLVIWMRILM